MVDAEAAVKAGGAEIAAICDVDSDHLRQSADELEKLQGTRPTMLKLYQDLLDLKGLDAVIIATPPHWHAIPFIAALEKGLDVYCEKPLAYDIREGGRWSRPPKSTAASCKSASSGGKARRWRA